jgi:endonuclease VIII
MPEGPSLLILYDSIKHIKGKKIVAASGNAKIDLSLLEGQKVVDLKTWGKQFFIVLKHVCIRIHFLLFGSYSIGEQTKPEKSLRLHLHFRNDDLFFYTCSVRLIDPEELDEYDWEADVMSDIWNPVKARRKLKLMPTTMVCDALLDQHVFAGVGNIIKNEVLYRIRMHPESLVGHVPAKKLSELIKEARNYSFDFLKWKKEFVLRKHWLAHTKKSCMRCSIPLVKKYCGKTQRRTFFCEKCQKKWDK